MYKENVLTTYDGDANPVFIGTRESLLAMVKEWLVEDIRTMNLFNEFDGEVWLAKKLEYFQAGEDEVLRLRNKEDEGTIYWVIDKIIGWEEQK